MNETKNNTLILLGFCGGTIPYVAEVANKAAGLHHFDVVKNIDVAEPKFPYQWRDFSFSTWYDTEYNFRSSFSKVHFAVHSPHIKYVLYHYFRKRHGVSKTRYASLVHPLSHVSTSSTFSNGFLMEELAAVSVFSKIGFGASIKRGVTVGHHADLGDFVSLNPGVNVSGFVSIGAVTEIGTGTSIVNNVKIGKHCLIGAGSVVTKDIPDGVIAYGNPCKVIRENERWQKAHKIVSAN